VIGANTISASGEMGSRLDTAVVFRASGPDNSFLRAVSGLQGLPARPYEIGAEITVARDGYRLRNATAQFGGFALRAQGEISTLPDFSGTQLGVAVSGPDLRNVALLTGIEELPDGAFELAGMLAIDEGDLRLSEVTAIVGDLRGALAGRIGLAGNSGQFDLE
ncbi:MAG: hypothetical protein GTO71_11330, partial [Woeseiaceae bacterium]|nr:hypothetical protein [Woeseiaceae bacterium]NIP21659.1 hypothetical protein [Woeseiaceae bacterium]